MSTPGIRTAGHAASLSSVAELPTAVPAFIGHTERADDRGRSLAMRPTRIGSLAEFKRCFGGAPRPCFQIREALADGPTGGPGHAGPLACTLERVDSRYRLYHGVCHYFQNGGGPCYIVSVGSYRDAIAAGALDRGITTLAGEQEPALLVVPDAVSLDEPGCIRVQQAMLAHCGNPQQRQRFAILDIWGGDRPLPGGDDGITRFRGALGDRHLGFGAAYHPWLHTTGVAEGELDDSCFDAASQAWLHSVRTTDSPRHAAVLAQARRQLDLMPPSPALAGVYALVDRTRGVWKAPANVALAGVLRPALGITSADQDGLTVPVSGRSINALRAVAGQGVLVWGARTLDGNSLDWRYVNVRRTAIMIEQSCRLAVQALASAPNVDSTWSDVKGMLGQFLHSVWTRGGLAGAAPDDAFSVHCGLGETMTPDDIVEGTLRVTLLVAISRPAEFIEIGFQQTAQTPVHRA